MLAAFLSLGGCTTTTQSTSHPQSDGIAASVDSDVRRRARIRLELAANYLQNGQTAVALEEAAQSINTDPTFADAYHLRGLIYMQMNDVGQAEDNLSRAQNMRPNDPDIMQNLGWLRCQKEQYAQADHLFDKALATPGYAARTRTLMSKGVCQARAQQFEQAEATLLKAYEMDAGNSVVGFELATLAFRRGDASRAQFYIRRVNNGNFASAQSLWLGIKIERALGQQATVRQLADQLRKRFPDSKEMLAYERGAFNE
nr:type IV pilus biogenesis/stability protein PilW [Diaphorobacter sp.]